MIMASNDLINWVEIEEKDMCNWKYVNVVVGVATSAVVCYYGYCGGA